MITKKGWRFKLGPNYTTLFQKLNCMKMKLKFHLGSLA